MTDLPALRIASAKLQSMITELRLRREIDKRGCNPNGAFCWDCKDDCPVKALEAL